MTKRAAKPADSRRLSEIGLGPSVQMALYAACFFPFAGFIIGMSYNSHHHTPTRNLGWRLLLLSLLTHTIYLFFVCPWMAWVALS